MATAPVVSDVIEVLNDAGFTAPDEATLQRMLNASIAEFEKRTGWQPFVTLAAATAVAMFLDPPKVPYEPVRLPDCATTVTAVSVDITPLDTIGRALLTSEFQTIDYNGPGELRPITHIRLLDGTWFSGYNYRSVKITAKKGALTAWPEDAKQAVIGYAALLVTATIEGGGNRISEIKQGPVTIKYERDESGAADSGSQSWESYFTRVVGFYQRVVV